MPQWHTLLCHKKRVLHLCNTPISIFSILCVFLLRCGISATPCLTRSFSKPHTLLFSLQISRASSESFEPLWTPWSLWASLNALKAIEPHWRSLTPAFPLNPLTRSARSHFSDSPLRVTVFSGIPNIPLIALQYHCVLGNRPSVIESTGRGSPHHYLLIYYTLATLSTKNEAIFSHHNI